MTSLSWQSEFGWQWQSDSSARYQVLVVDDDVNLGRLLRTILRSGGFDVIAAMDGLEALEVLEREQPHVIILDLRMPRLDGRSFYREMRSRGYATPVLIASAYGARSAQIELGAQGSIEKPFDPDRLLEAVIQLCPASGSGYLANCQTVT